MKPERTIVAGSLKTDLVAGLESLPREGERVPRCGLMLRSGGKGASQASAAGRPSGCAAMIGQVGCGALAAHLAASLPKAGADPAGIGTSPCATGGALSPPAPPGLGNLAPGRPGGSLEAAYAVVTHASRRGAVAVPDSAPARPPGSSEMAIDNFDGAARAADRRPELGAAAAVLKIGARGRLIAGRGFRGGLELFPVAAADATDAGHALKRALEAGLAEGMPDRGETVRPLEDGYVHGG